MSAWETKFATRVSIAETTLDLTSPLCSYSTTVARTRACCGECGMVPMGIGQLSKTEAAMTHPTPSMSRCKPRPAPLTKQFACAAVKMEAAFDSTKTCAAKAKPGTAASAPSFGDRLPSDAHSCARGIGVPSVMFARLTSTSGDTTYDSAVSDTNEIAGAISANTVLVVFDMNTDLCIPSTARAT